MPAVPDNAACNSQNGVAGIFREDRRDARADYVADVGRDSEHDSRLYSCRNLSAVGVASLAPRRATEFRVSRTCHQVIVDHAGRLHQRVTNG